MIEPQGNCISCTNIVAWIFI